MQPVVGMSQPIKKEKITNSIETKNEDTQMDVIDIATKAGLAAFGYAEYVVHRAIMQRVWNGAKVIGKKVMEKAMNNPKTALATTTLTGLGVYVYNNHYDAIRKWFVRDRTLSTTMCPTRNATRNAVKSNMQCPVKPSYWCNHSELVCMLKSSVLQTQVWWNRAVFLIMNEHFHMLEMILLGLVILDHLTLMHRLLSSEIEHSPVCIELAKAPWWEILLFLFRLLCQLVINFLKVVRSVFVSLVWFILNQCGKLVNKCKRDKTMKQEQEKKEKTDTVKSENVTPPPPYEPKTAENFEHKQEQNVHNAVKVDKSVQFKTIDDEPASIGCLQELGLVSRYEPLENENVENVPVERLFFEPTNYNQDSALFFSELVNIYVHFLAIFNKNAHKLNEYDKFFGTPSDLAHAIRKCKACVVIPKKVNNNHHKLILHTSMVLEQNTVFVFGVKRVEYACLIRNYVVMEVHLQNAYSKLI